jgi:hypothetical protein
MYPKVWRGLWRMIPYITGTKALKTKTAPTRSEYWPTRRTGGHQARMTAEANNRTVENQPVMANFILVAIGILV